MKLSRRRFSQMAAGAGALASLSSPISLFAQSLQLSAHASRTRHHGRRARDFMQRYDVPALSVAIGAGGAIVYRDAFGVVDREAGEAATPDNRFRIASVTKPITSVAIFSLVEAGRIRLSDRVFGTGAITGTDMGGPPSILISTRSRSSTSSLTPAAAGRTRITARTATIRCSSICKWIKRN